MVYIHFLLHCNFHPPLDSWHFGNRAVICLTDGFCLCLRASLFGEGVVGLSGPVTSRRSQKCSPFSQQTITKDSFSLFLFSSLSCNHLFGGKQWGEAVPRPFSLLCVGEKWPVSHFALLQLQLHTRCNVHWPLGGCWSSFALIGHKVQQDTRTQVFIRPFLCFRLALLSYVLSSWHGVSMVTDNIYWI